MQVETKGVNNFSKKHLNENEFIAELLKNEQLYQCSLSKLQEFLKGNKIKEYKVNERVDNTKFNCKNIIFDKELNANIFLFYPLSVKVSERIKATDLHGLISEIRKVYSKIYEEEKITQKHYWEIPNSYNRGFSDGKFGIWGHEIGDLYIERIIIYQFEDEFLIIPNIGS